MRAPPRILVVDDNRANVDILRARLAAHGYEIVTASDGEEALAAVAAQQPDLILLDVMMPKLDGIEVCRRLRADASCPSSQSSSSPRRAIRRISSRRWKPAATNT